MPPRPRRNNDDGSSPSSSGSSGSFRPSRAKKLGSKDYVVERITGERVKHGKRQFRVHWEGYLSEDDSWVDERHCNCLVLIAAFRRQRDRKKARARKPDEEDDLDGSIVSDGQDSEDLAADDREMDDFIDDSDCDDDDDDDDDYDYEGEEEEEKDERKTRTSPRKRAPKRTPQSRRVTRRSARMKNDTGLDESDVSDVDAQENDVDDNDVEEVEVDEAVTPRTRRSRRSQKSEESCSQEMTVRKKRRRSKKIDSDEEEEEEKEEEKEEDGKQEKSQEDDGKQEKSQEDNSQMVSPMRTKRGRMIKVDIDEDDELYEEIQPQTLEDSPDDWEEMALEVLKRLNNAATFEEVESYEANVWSPNADVPRTPRNIVGVRRLFEKVFLLVSYIENGPSTSSAVNPLKYDLVSSSMLRQIAPNLLVDYYESALVFRES